MASHKGSWTNGALSIGMLVGLTAIGVASNLRFSPRWHIHKIDITTQGVHPFTDTVQLRRRLQEIASDTSLDMGNLLKALHHEMIQHTYVKDIAFQVMHSGKINIQIQEQVPLLRVIPTHGNAYYVASDSTVLPLSLRSTVHVLTVSGDSIAPYSPKEKIRSIPLLKALQMGRFLDKHKEWSPLVGHLYIAKNGQFQLITRIGHYPAKIGSDIHRLSEQLDLLKEIFPYIIESSPQVIDLRYPKTAIVALPYNARNRP